LIKFNRAFSISKLRNPEVINMTRKTKQPNWLMAPEEHDYPAAASYLLIIIAPKQVARLVKGLRKAEISFFKAKDIFRASGLSLLGVSNSHVEKDRKKITKGIPISPLLLVRDSQNARVIIADGYHRLCAIYGFDEDADIPCKII
jgi:hypothetical protein